MNIIALFLGWLWLLAQIAAAGVTVQVEYRDSPWTDVINGQQRTIIGEVWCYADGPRMVLLRTALPDVVVHEYAHAWDCADNGRMDGSPGSTPQQTGHCNDNDAERYACWYTRTHGG